MSKSNPLSIDQFAERIKTKYPEYQDLDNNALVDKILSKYPEYSDMVNLGESKKKNQEPGSQGTDALAGGASESSTGTSASPTKPSLSYLDTALEDAKLPAIENLDVNNIQAILNQKYGTKTPTQIDTEGRVAAAQEFGQKKFEQTTDYAAQQVDKAVTERQTGKKLGDELIVTPEKKDAFKMSFDPITEQPDATGVQVQALGYEQVNEYGVKLEDLENEEVVSKKTKDAPLEHRGKHLSDVILNTLSKEMDKENSPYWKIEGEKKVLDRKRLEKEFKHLDEKYVDFLENYDPAQVDLNDSETKIPYTAEEIKFAMHETIKTIEGGEMAQRVKTLADLQMAERGYVPYSSRVAGMKSIQSEAERVLDSQMQAFEKNLDTLGKDLQSKYSKLVAEGQMTVEQATNALNAEVQEAYDFGVDKISQTATEYDEKLKPYALNEEEKNSIKSAYKAAAKLAYEEKVIKDAAKYSRMTLPEKLDKAMNMGWQQTLGSIGYATEALGMKDADAEFMRHIGRSMANTTEENLKEITDRFGAPDLERFSFSSLLNPDWWVYRGVSTVPFMMSILPLGAAGASAGAAAGASLGFGAVGSMFTAGAGGAIMSRPIESFMEAGMAYNENYKEHQDIDKALKSFNRVFNRNMALAGLDALQIGTAFAALKGLKMPRKLGGGYTVAGLQGLSEGVEETLQHYFNIEEGDMTLANYYKSAMSPEGLEAGVLGFGMGVGMHATFSVFNANSERAVEEMAASLLDDGIVNKMRTTQEKLEQAKIEKDIDKQKEYEAKLKARVNQIANTTQTLVNQGVITQSEQVKLMEHVAAEAKMKMGTFGDILTNTNLKQRARSIYHKMHKLEQEKEALIGKRNSVNEKDINQKVDDINSQIESLQGQYQDVVAGRTEASYFIDGVLVTRDDFRKFVSNIDNVEKIRKHEIDVRVEVAEKTDQSDMPTIDDEVKKFVDLLYAGETTSRDASLAIILATENRQEATTRRAMVDTVAERMADRFEGYDIHTTESTKDFIERLQMLGVSKEDAQEHADSSGVYFSGEGRVVINKDLANIDVVYHEVFHPIVENIKESIGVENFEAMANEFFKGTKEAAPFIAWAENNYEGKALHEIFEEALVEYHAYLTRQKLDSKLNENRTFWRKVIDWLKQGYETNKDGMDAIKYRDGVNFLDFLSDVTDEFVDASITEPKNKVATEEAKKTVNLRSNNAFKQELLDAMQGRGEFVHMTAENPNNQPLSPEENAKRNEELKALLIKRGYKPIEIDGYYDRPENSFFVKGMGVDESMEIGKMFGQESVMHNVGLIYTTGENAGKMNPTLGTIEDNQEATNYFSAIETEEGKFKYNLDIDWDSMVDAPIKEETTIKRSLIGQHGATNLGIKAMNRLAEAEQLEKAGKDAEHIWLATGWERGFDNKWRWELKTDKVDFNVSRNDLWLEESGLVKSEVRGKLSDLIDFPELFTAYPKAGEIELILTEDMDVGGSYSDVNNTIELNVDIDDIYDGSQVSNKKQLSTLLHEIQHFIQDTEGFTTGTNMVMGETYRREVLRANDPKFKELYEESEELGRELDKLLDERLEVFKEGLSYEELSKKQEQLKNSYETLQEQKNKLDDEILYLEETGKGKRLGIAMGYYNQAGEVEARNVEKRFEMSDDNKLFLRPSKTEDVSRETQHDINELLKTIPKYDWLYSDEVKQSKAIKDSKVGWAESTIGRGDKAIVNRNPIVKEAAEQYYQGEISQQEYLDIVNEHSPIKPILDFIKPAKEEDIAFSVGKKSEGKVNKQFEEGTNVGLRLDIPAYVNHNIWAITVHEAGKGGRPLSYNNVAKITNVTFESNPIVALDIARQKQLSSGKKMGKATIARMMGKWAEIEGATAEEKGQNAMDFVDSILNDPNWVQVGMNPFRHSYFYDRADGMPVVSADEVIQIGGLVYAKNVEKTTPKDSRFEAVEKKTGKVIKFSKGDWKLFHGNNRGLSLEQAISKFNTLNAIKDDVARFEAKKLMDEKAAEERKKAYDKIKNIPVVFEIDADRFHGETKSGKAYSFSQSRFAAKRYNFMYVPKSIATIETIGDKVRVSIPRWKFDQSPGHEAFNDWMETPGFVAIEGFMSADFAPVETFKGTKDWNGPIPAKLIDDVATPNIKASNARVTMDHISRGEVLQTYIPEGHFARQGFKKTKASKLNIFGDTYESFDLSQLEGKDILIVPGDLMGTGVYTGYREGSDIRIEMDGGPLFGAKHKGAIWAFTNDNQFNSFMNMASDTNDMIMLFVSQGPLSHRGNSVFSQIWVAELRESILRGEITEVEALARINELINEVTTTGKKVGSPRWEKIHGRNFNSIEELESSLVVEGTYDLRRDFMDAMGAMGIGALKSDPSGKFEKPGSKFHGLPNLSKMLEMTLEDRLPLKDTQQNAKNPVRIVPRGTIITVGKVNASNPKGEQIHPGYPVTVNGEFLGAPAAGIDVAALLEYSVTQAGLQYYSGTIKDRQKKLGGYTKNGAHIGSISMRVKDSKLPPLGISADNIRMIETGGVGQLSASVNWKNVGLNLKKNFTTRGLMTKETFTRNLEKEFETKAKFYDVEKIVEKFQKTVESVYGKELSSDVLESINQALTGRYELSDMLPQEIQDIIEEMRSYIDSLSQHLVDEGIVQGDLEAMVAANIGVYINRTYEIFENPDYSVPIEVWNNAVAELRAAYEEKGLDLTEEQANNILSELFAEMSGLQKDPTAFLRAKTIISRDIKAFKKRKDIPKWMREFMGETKDPVTNFHNTAAKLIHIIEQSKFLADLREIGFSQGFLSDSYDPEKFPKRIVKEREDKYDPYYPLTHGNALYTTPEFAEVMRMLSSEPSQRSMLSTAMFTLNYLFKYGATVGSVQTHIRNFMSNTLVCLAFGYSPMSREYHLKMWDAIKPENPNTGKREWNEMEVRRLIQLGVIRDGVYAGEVKDIVDDIVGERTETPVTKLFESKVASILKGGKNIVDKMYRAEDDYWKVYIYYNLMEDYQKVYPSATREQLQVMAAQDIQKHAPTYSMVPHIVKQIKKMPLVGTFPSFVSEILRNTINHAVDNYKMIRHGSAEQRAFGLKRSAGFVSAISFGSLLAGLGVHLAKQMFDWDDDKHEALHELVAPWSRRSDLVPVAYKNGEVYYFDFSSLDPYSHIKKSSKALAALASGNDIGDDELFDIMNEVFGPWLGLEPVAEAFEEIIANEDAMGRQIYNREEDAGTKAKVMFEYIGRVITPGTIKSFQKIVDPKRDMFLETVSTFAGVRISKLSPSKSYYFAVMNSVDDAKEQSKLYYSVARKEDVSVEDKDAALEKANDKLQKNYESLYETKMNARRLGLSKKQAHQMTVMPSEQDIYIGNIGKVSMLIGEAFPIIPTHRNLNQAEQVKVAKNLQLAAKMGVVTADEVKSIIKKYFMAGVKNEMINQLATGDYFYDYEMRKLVKKKIK